MKEYLDLPAPAFSKFRDLMETWDKICFQENEKQSISDLMDKKGLILFFKKGADIFGAPEDSRIIFAKLKSNDDDEPMMHGFRDEARFVATNLMKALFGSPEESHDNLFKLQDIPDMEVCDREDAIDQLMKHKEQNAITISQR